MKISLRAWAMLLGIAIGVAGGPARALETTWATYSPGAKSQSETFRVASSYAAEVTEVSDSCCSSCGKNDCGGKCDGCGSCDPGFADCDNCPNFGLVGWAGLDNYRGLTDGTWPGNFGLVSGVNLGHRLPGILNEMGIGWQTGMSYGIYDLQGRLTAEPARSQQQFFATTGFFRRATAGNQFSFACVYDWMVNDNFGVFSSEPFLGQWRGLIGYALSTRNEIGWWGAFADRRDTQNLGGTALGFRSVTQQNLYWRHQMNCGVSSFLYVGIPERHRLSGPGSLGEWTLGGLITAPLSNRLATYINFAYMCPSAPAGFAAREEFWQLGGGLAFYPGRALKSRNVAGRCWMPLMPVATNGTFMVDTNLTQ